MTILSRIKLNKICLTVLTFPLIAAVSIVQAAHLNIDDSVEGQITLGHDANWTYGVISNGTAFGNKVAGSTVAVGELASFSGDWFVNVGQNGSGTVYIVAPGTDTIVARVDGSWSTTSAGDASIDLRVTSSACGNDLGTTPDGVTGVPEPEGGTLINNSFVDANGDFAPIPSNLTINFISSVDSDCDGVPDVRDYCSNTTVPESGVPSTGALGTNRFALIDNDGTFDTTPPKGKGPRRTYTIDETGGCSCGDIIENLDLGQGHTKHGCSISAMDTWVEDYAP